jgi:glycosyltransferase involved in cell wall biosynthesis
MVNERLPVSAVILTLNEENHLPTCLESLSWADQIVVVDSGSEDRTVAIARGAGALVVEQPWLGWSNQRQRGIVAARNDWVFVIEADEAVSRILEASIRQAILGGPLETDAFAVDRRGDYLGILLPNSQRPRMVRSFVRLFNRKTAAYTPDELIHERVVTSGCVTLLEGILLHWRGARLIDYARMNVKTSRSEADYLRTQGKRPSVLRLVTLPAARFLYLYIVKGEWRLGTRGYLHAAHRAHGDHLRMSFLWEDSQPPSPSAAPLDARML